MQWLRNIDTFYVKCTSQANNNYAVGVIAACVADIAFVIDNSGSIRDNDPPGVNNWQLIINFVKSIIDDLTVGSGYARIAVVDFGW